MNEVPPNAAQVEENAQLAMRKAFSSEPTLQLPRAFSFRTQEGRICSVRTVASEAHRESMWILLFSLSCVLGKKAL
jgi:hypothetical protein